jgi:hypothetical protein
MRLSKLFVFLILSALSYSFAAEELDFSKKSSYYFREGEYGVISLNLKNSETYDYKSEIRKPFVLKKGKNGNIEIIYDVRTMGADELEDGKTYSVSFPFVKANIGKKENLRATAVYRPELRIVENDTLKTDYIRLDFNPDQTERTITIEALRDTRNITLDDPDGLVKFGEGETLSLAKGLNEVVIKLKNNENKRGESVIQRKVGEGAISRLYLLVNATGFSSALEPVTDEEVETELDQEYEADPQEEQDLYGGIETGTESENTESSGGFGILSIIIILLMALVIVALLILLLKNKKGDLYEKYETFFDDVATLVKVNYKGTNIDKSIEEIMMILLEKFEFSPEDKSKPAESKRTLKKPAGIKKPPVVKEVEPEAEKDIDLDLNFDDDKTEEKKNDGDTEKKVTRGFDFLDE